MVVQVFVPQKQPVEPLTHKRQLRIGDTVRITRVGQQAPQCLA
jgi:hypothetical protein